MAVGFGSGNVEAWGDEDPMNIGLIGQSLEDFTATCRQCCAANEEKREVRTELGGEIVERREGSWVIEQGREGEEQSGGIGGATAETAAHGDAFGDTDADLSGETGGFEEETGSLHSKVFARDASVAFDINRDYGGTGGRDFERVSKGNGLKDGGDFMEVIGPSEEDLQAEI